MRTVGILGGMGPGATVALMARVIAVTRARDDADHVPLLVDQNTAVPSRIAHLIEATGKDPGPTLAMMAQRLTHAGAQALAMPCNTAHHYAPAIRAASDLPFLDMVALGVTEAAAQAADEVAILASPAVRIAGVFDRPCAAAGLVPRYIADENASLALIRAIKQDGATAAARRALADLAAALATPVCLIACTEFSLAAAPGPGMIDTLDVLARAIVTFSGGTLDG